MAVLERSGFVVRILGPHAVIEADRLRPGNRELERVGLARFVIAPPDRGLASASISSTKPAEISLFATFGAAPPFSFGKATRHRSSRCAAALSMASCVSVSLIDIDEPFASLMGAQPTWAPH